MKSALENWKLLAVVIAVVLLGTGLYLSYISSWLSNYPQAEHARRKVDTLLGRVYQSNYAERPARVVKNLEAADTSLPDEPYYVYGRIKDADNLDYGSETEPVISNDWFLVVDLFTGQRVPIHVSFDSRAVEVEHPFVGNYRPLVLTDDLNKPFKPGDIVRLYMETPTVKGGMEGELFFPTVIVVEERST